MELEIFQECLAALNVPDWIYIDRAIWGSRFSNKKTDTPYHKNGDVNVDYVEPGKINSSPVSMKNKLLDQWNKLATSEDGEQFCLFLLMPEVKVKKYDGQPTKHSNVLIVRRFLDRNTCE